MFILCKGKMAENPYKMPYTEKKVYSLEELCHYIYHNIYSINEDFFQESLAAWFRDELELPELAKKMENLLAGRSDLRDMVVTVLCGCDFFREEEIRGLVRVMDTIANLPIHRKKKIKADNYLRAGRYGKSLLSYRKLLHGSFAVNFTTEEYGDILHNQGIAHFYTSSFREAENDFREAYARNNKKDSLMHYLWLLLIQDKRERFASEAVAYSLSDEETEEIEEAYKDALAECSVPDGRDDDIERYKRQLRTAFSC